MKKLFTILVFFGAAVVLSAQTSGGVTVEPGADVTIEPGVTINVNNGNFTVLVEENARGSFLEQGDLTFTGSGEARMQQYLTKDQWHAVASPMSNEDIGVYEWMYLYSWDEPSKDWTNLVLPETLPLNPGEGYYVWNTLDTNTIFPNTPYYTVTHNGTFNKNDVVTSPTYTTGGQGTQLKGWNLMGNPFPCAIDWNGHADWNLENVGSTVYFGDYSVSGNYPTWDWDTQIGTLGKTDGYIAATQGFWVKTEKAPGNPNNAVYSLTIPASQRLHSDTTPFYKSESTINELLRLRVDGNNYYDEAIIGFIPDATIGFDHYDAYKMKGRAEAPQLYSIVDDEMLTINFLAEVTEDLVIPLGFEVGAAGQYTINATEIEGFGDTQFIYLEDLKENTIRDLKINPEYTFTSAPLDDAERFLIHFKNTAFAIDENSLEQFVNIYAYDNKVFIDITGQHGGDVVIHNMLGQEISTTAVFEGKQSIRIDDVGYLLVTLITEKGIYSKKIFIN